MKAASALGERGARRASPALFLLATLCFFLPFVGVSCNTSAARTALDSSSAIGRSGLGTAAVDACVNAYAGVNLVSYSGFNLALGSAPTVSADLKPAACRGVEPGAPEKTPTSIA